MNRFWLWSKWLYHGRSLMTGLRFRVESLEQRPAKDAQRITELEKAMAHMQAAHAEELHEIRERLDGRIRRSNPSRTFQQMRHIAELGEQAMRKQREETHA